MPKGLKIQEKDAYPEGISDDQGCGRSEESFPLRCHPANMRSGCPFSSPEVRVGSISV
jgi:hypothetical protein